MHTSSRCQKRDARLLDRACRFWPDRRSALEEQRSFTAALHVYDNLSSVRVKGSRVKHLRAPYFVPTSQPWRAPISQVNPLTDRLLFPSLYVDGATLVLCHAFCQVRRRSCHCVHNSVALQYHVSYPLDHVITPLPSTGGLL
jgi:hypothetical protein